MLLIAVKTEEGLPPPADVLKQKDLRAAAINSFVSRSCHAPGSRFSEDFFPRSPLKYQLGRACPSAPSLGDRRPHSSPVLVECITRARPIQLRFARVAAVCRHCLLGTTLGKEEKRKKDRERNKKKSGIQMTVKTYPRAAISIYNIQYIFQFQYTRKGKTQQYNAPFNDVARNNRALTAFPAHVGSPE